MDAYGGLDDIRGVQVKNCGSMPIHAGMKTLEVAKRTFPYLFPRPPTPGEIPRHVASINFIPFQPFVPFRPGKGEGLEIIPLPFVHGEDCTCYGFAFGEKDRVLYISDVSRITSETKSWIKEWMGSRGVKILVIDALLLRRSHPTHFSLSDAAEFIREIRPDKSYIVGISCDDWPTHDEANVMLEGMFKDDGLEVEMAWDGLKINLDL